MAESLDDAEFWLPSQFLSDHDINFPSEFPYEFDSPVESVVSSNETSEISSDEEDFLAALTQRLRHSTLRDSLKPSLQTLTHHSKSEGKVGMARSPQSTLSGFGNWSRSPSQAPSPPATPFSVENNTWDLIYAAAGQVARMKMNGGDGIMGPPRTGLLYPQVSRTVQKLQNQQIQRCEREFHNENGRFGVPQYAWPSFEETHRRRESPAMIPVFPGGGSVPRKECAGTGVFLPRRYDNNPPQSFKKTDSRPVSGFSGKAAHGRNPSLEDLNRSNRRLAQSYVGDAIIGRRNAVLAQQRLIYQRPTEGVKSHELLLPQEWTY